MDFSQILAKEIAKKKATVQNAHEFKNNLDERASIPCSNTQPKQKEYIPKADMNDMKKAKEEPSKANDKSAIPPKESDTNLKRPRNRDDFDERENRKRKVREEWVQKMKEKELQKEEELKQKEELQKFEENLLSDEQILIELKARGYLESDLQNEPRSSLVKKLHKINEREEKQRRIQMENSVNMEIIESEILHDREKVQAQMAATIRTLLSEWKNVLEKNNDTPDQAKQVLRETVSYCKPLLTRLRSKDNPFPEKLYNKLARLFMHIQKHQYREANSIYIKMSIGNAAWPVGVTAVGIHARSARERITGENNESSGVDVAHILSDEDTRKWIIAVKRFITFAEAHLQDKSFQS
ncbi:uncharacterized protein SAPINGB_P003894 [Magnusiomyces paraingens]|uniref:Pre-mRNA-splicing factor 18 n=1 Tax=Magnusiomyces paraingens TaxID=2606893 RepID=A0A5E8BZ47_9ASCO|nr:uncharacterized protein SAPINGB_P003894 [Saprochaete ingens]VVT54075.1 unnamed protein product [Saprochaete ingens]